MISESLWGLADSIDNAIKSAFRGHTSVFNKYSANPSTTEPYYSSIQLDKIKNPDIKDLGINNKTLVPLTAPRTRIALAIMNVIGSHYMQTTPGLPNKAIMAITTQNWMQPTSNGVRYLTPCKTIEFHYYY